MNYIDILPQIRNNIFHARIVMSDYNVEKQLVIRIVARRNDGFYKTEIIKYPKPDVQYDGEIIVPFFGMAKSLVAQIVGVRINGAEVRVHSTDIEGEDITARYDDSLTRMGWEADMNNIKLDFEVVSTNNPMTLRVADQSEWGILSDRPAIIEITPPEDTETYTYYLGKNQLNVFNSKTLGINPGPEKKFVSLNDGIYDITIKGSPSSYSFNRKYLKTDSIRLNIDKIWARAGVLCDEENTEVIEKLKEIEFCLTAAEASMRLGNLEDVKALYNRAKKLIHVLNNCKDCGCGIVINN